MGAIDVLLREYPGDHAWQNFVDVFRPAWAQQQDKAKYISALGGEEFAIVLTASMGDRSVAWFETPVGALEQRSPASVLKDEPSGRTILKSMLMRMPR
jgi:GGDEF domain-containing protein